jgi:ribose 5-phosphate isomerase A
MSTTDDLSDPIDLAVDGADEIDPELRLIKGRGGALTREKLVALAARKVVIIADGSKLVRCLGKGALPVEVLPFLWRQTAERLALLGATYRVRGELARPFVTDNGNLIVDLGFPNGIVDPGALGAELKQTAGVVEHGIFVGLADACFVAEREGVRVMGSLN